MFSKKRTFLLIAITVTVVFLVVSAVYAAHVTIDTDDGAVDAEWANVPMSFDAGVSTNANYDIVEAWVGNAADNSAFYFRVNLADGGQLPQNYSVLEARLDCNQDGDYTDAEDVVVYYALDTWLVEPGNPLGEEVVECQGSDYINCDYLPEPNNSDTNPVTFGEEIAGTPYNYEWQADVNNGDTDWSACLGTFNVQFASVNASGVVQDITGWRPYSAPNAVALSGVAAQTSFTSVSVFVLGVMAVGALIVIRRKLKGE